MRRRSALEGLAVLCLKENVAIVANANTNKGGSSGAANVTDDMIREMRFEGA